MPFFWPNESQKIEKCKQVVKIHHLPVSQSSGEEDFLAGSFFLYLMACKTWQWSQVSFFYLKSSNEWEQKPS